MTAAKPLKDLKLTQPFGVDWMGGGFYAKFGLRGHNGWDFSCPVGTDVFAPIGGEVEARDDGGYGKSVRIRSRELDTECVLGHMGDFCVRTGDSVKAGNRVGLSGNTGLSTGPHLHVGFRRIWWSASGAGPWVSNHENGYLGYIDPADVFPPDILNLPVDDCYHVSPVSVAEFAPAFLHFLRSQGRTPSRREYVALRWGRWPLRDVIDPAMFAAWSKKTYIEYAKK
jgi:murein DD-endopeptidase MepM/ murein hydrolase activator NlpD